MAIDKDVLFHFERNKAGDIEFLNLFNRIASDITMESVLADDRQGCELAHGTVIVPDGVQKLHKTALENGLIGMTYDSALGANLSTVMAWYETIFAKHSDGYLTPLLTDGIIDALSEFASEEIKNEYIPLMMEEGQLGAMLMTEAGAGSDVGGIVTRAKKDGDVYKLSGVKTFVSGPHADQLLVLARDDDTFDEFKGRTKGLSMYLVPKELDEGTNEGVKITGLEHKLGLFASPTGTVEFDGATGYLVGEKGKGFTQFLRLMNFARLSVAAQALGTAQGSLDYAQQYAEERKQFGKNISEFSQVRDMLIDMKVDVEASRALIYEAAQAQDEGRPEADIFSCLAKYLVPKLAQDVTDKGIQVLGGYGFSEEYPQAKRWRDVRVVDLYEGTGQVQASMVSGNVARGAFDSVIKEMYDYFEENNEETAKSIRMAFMTAGKGIKALSKEQIKEGAYADEITSTLGTFTALYLLAKQSEESERKASVAQRFYVNHFARPVHALNNVTDSFYRKDTSMEYFNHIMNHDPMPKPKSNNA